jgi:hypothetical protein
MNRCRELLDDILAWCCAFCVFCAAAGAMKNVVPASNATAVAQAVVFAFMLKSPWLIPTMTAFHRIEIGTDPN